MASAGSGSTSVRAAEGVKILIQEFEMAKISIENLGSRRMKPKLLVDHFGLTLGEALMHASARAIFAE